MTNVSQCLARLIRSHGESQGGVQDVQPEFRFIVDYTVLFRPPI
jgi:hypothetical protein